MRIRRPELPRPFRMWLYPIPAVLAIVGFCYIVIARHNFLKEIRYAAVILTAGLVLYMVRARRNHEWPFGAPLPSPAEIQAS